MRFTTTASIITLASSLAQVQAYYLVAGSITGFGGPVGQTGNTWRMAADLECDTLNNASPVVNDRSDVSGDKDGVRVAWIDGDCGSWIGTQCPTEVEQHFPGLHQSKSIPPFNRELADRCSQPGMLSVTATCMTWKEML